MCQCSTSFEIIQVSTYISSPDYKLQQGRNHSCLFTAVSLAPKSVPNSETLKTNLMNEQMNNVILIHCFPISWVEKEILGFLHLLYPPKHIHPMSVCLVSLIRTDYTRHIWYLH